MGKIIRACLGGKVKFNTAKWNEYEIRLFHNESNFRSMPPFGWIPYYWDSETVFDLGLKVPKAKELNEDVKYHWELKDLDGQVVVQGGKPKQGDDIVLVTNKGFRRKLIYWNSGKRRAVVLGNLYPHREYILHMKFRNDYSESDTFQMVSLTVEDRTNWQMQVFIGIFLIIFAIWMSYAARACSMGSID